MKKTLLNGGGKPFIREMFYNSFINTVSIIKIMKGGQNEGNGIKLCARFNGA